MGRRANLSVLPGDPRLLGTRQVPRSRRRALPGADSSVGPRVSSKGAQEAASLIAHHQNVDKSTFGYEGDWVFSWSAPKP